MALRHIWFLFTLIVAAAVAVLSLDLMPAFIDWATGAKGSGFDALFRNDDLLRVAAGIAVGTLVLFLLFYLGVALFDGIGIAVAQRSLRTGIEATGDLTPSDVQSTLEDHAALEGPAATYIDALQEIPAAPGSGKNSKSLIASPRPAYHYFGPHKTIHARVYRWLFDPLPVLLMAVGTGLVMLKATSALGQRSGPSLSEMMEPQIVGLLLLTTSALLIYVIKRIVLGIRYQQTVSFCDYLDGLFPMIGEIEHLNRLETITRDNSKSIVSAVNGMSKEVGRTLDAKLKDWQKVNEKSQKDLQDALVSGLEAALKDPVSTLAKASEKTGKDIAAQSKETLESVLNAFLDGLHQNFGKQAKDLKSTLEETEKAAKEMNKAYKESLELHHKSVEDSLQAYAGSFGQTAASFESLQAAVDNLLTLTTPLLRQMISHQEGLLSALEQESASSKVIGRAASELSQAAQASRDTVEQFVTLAERLRETSKVIGGNGAAFRGSADKELVKQLRALKSDFSEASE
jgi:hypothetical protein